MKLVKEFLKNPELVSSSLPYEDALAAVEKLHLHGAEVHVASSRKENLHKSMLEWLETHGFMVFVTRVHFRNSSVAGVTFKQASAHAAGAIAAFDDTYDVCEGLAEIGLDVFMMEKPWNADQPVPENILVHTGISAAVDDFIEREGLTAAPLGSSN